MTHMNFGKARSFWRWWCMALIPAGTIFYAPSSHGGANDFLLVSKGAAQVQIVIKEQTELRPGLVLITKEHPDPPLAFAATELQRYVKEMSGVELAIVNTLSKKPAIVLAVGPVEPLSEPRDRREEDHYRIQSDGNKFQVKGVSPRAVLFGVYDLLERLGCGWCVPGDDTIPKKSTLKLPALHVNARPAFQYRMMVDFPMMSEEQSIAIADWLAKNRMNWIHPAPNAYGEPKLWLDRRDHVLPEYQKRGLHVNLGGHTMHTWVPTNNFAAHPEWFAYGGKHPGEREAPTLCVSNEEMTREAIKNIVAFLNRCPEVEIVDFWHPDDEIFCYCEKCTRGLLPESTKGKKPDWMRPNTVKSSYLISYIEFINRVAEGVAKTHPKVLVSPLMYSHTEQAMLDDSPAMADNVIPGLAHIMRDSYCPLSGEPKSTVNERFLGIDLTWISKSKHHYIYEYYNCWIAPFVYPGAQVVARDLQIMHELGIQGSSSDMWGYTPVNMYVAARALWSPDISWEAATRDFCVRYFGDVGEEMAENEIRLNKGIFGKTGYQAIGARDPEKWKEPPTAGLYLKDQRDEQIAFLKRMIARTKDPQVKERLERQLKPWVSWNKGPRWWAFPGAKDEI